MNQTLLDKIESEQYRKNPLDFGVGDSVKVHTKVVEGDKERIQIFSGVVIGRRGHGLNATFTVRRISYGEGVERVFRCILRAWTRWKWSARARCAAPNSPICANAWARVQRW